MKQFYKIMSLVLIAGLLSSPVVEARNDRGQGEPHQRTTQHNNNGGQQRPGNNGGQQRPGNSGSQQRPGNSGGQRPGNNNGGQRPGNNGGQRPGNNGMQQGPGNNGVQQRPGNSGVQQGPGSHGNQQPNHGNSKPNHGNMGPGPGIASRPNQGPNHGNHWQNIHVGQPHRPMMPAHPHPWQPPRRPVYLPTGGPVISTILGVTLGTAINITINSLINHGYNVTAYADNTVYVRDAMQLGLLWPNATLYYTNGGLAGSEFVYSTPYYDMQRYYNAYNMLVGAYGVPYSTNNVGGTVTTTWWGHGGQYVQLQFNAATAYNGDYGYYTTLSFGGTGF